MYYLYTHTGEPRHPVEDLGHVTWVSESSNTLGNNTNTITIKPVFYVANKHVESIFWSTLMKKLDFI